MLSIALSRGFQLFENLWSMNGGRRGRGAGGGGRQVCRLSELFADPDVRGRSRRCVRGEVMGGNDATSNGQRDRERRREYE